MGGNELSLWEGIVSYLALVAGAGFTTVGLALLLIGLVLRWA